MKKNLLSLVLASVLSFGMNVSMAVGQPTEKVVMPYFNTNAGWSGRFSVVNPLNEKVTITLTIRDVEGNPVQSTHFVLNPFDSNVFGLFPTSNGGTTWFQPSNENGCVFGNINNELPVNEGYVTVRSEYFAVFSPGFCGNDYGLVNVRSLNYEYSLWQSDRGQRLESRVLPVVQTPTYSSWTQVNGRSTDWVVNLENATPGVCQSFEYLISDRDGYHFKTFDTSEPGPGGYPNFPLCHKVNVIHFGTPIFTTSVGVDANSEIPFSSNIMGTTQAGWMQLNTTSTSLSVRSEF
jgi:hypothetical protein